MSHFIKESTAHKLLLQRKGITGKVILFSLFGLLFFSIGLVLYSLKGSSESVPFEQIGILFMLFGGIGFYAGVNAPAQTKKTVPEQIEFDNQKGYVKIVQAVAGNLVSYIPYEDIQDLYVHVRVETSTNSTTTRSTSRTRYFGVRIRKKDKGEWEVFNSTSEAKAEDVLNTLREKVDLNIASSSIPKPLLTDKVTKDVKGNKSTIRWKNKGLAGLLMLLAFAGIFSYTFYFIFTMVAEDGATFAYIIGGFIALVFVFVIGVNMRKMLRNLFRVFGISINGTQFEYFEEDNSGMVQKSVIIPIQDIHSISFIFSPSDSTTQVSSLYVYTNTDVSKKENLENRSNPIQLIKEAYSLYTNLISLDLSSLNAVEKLEFERWLQETIREKSETVVL